ncbi:MAG: heavy metal-binding domain-containing protein, partial [Candidatus Binatia bacterium]
MSATDPVCGMTVDPVAPKGGTVVHQGATYGFCNPRCREKFAADPAHYLRGEHRQTAPPAPAAAYVCPMDPEVRADRPGACPKCGMALEPAVPSAATRTTYTCPMHPEVVRDAPGVCPICGMALEPRTVSAADEPNPELVDMTRRLWLSLLPTVPLFILAMSEMIPGQPLQHALSPGRLAWLQAALATPVVLWAGAPFFARGWQSLRSRHLNMFTLIALGVGVAYVYSLVATALPGLFPATVRGHGDSVPLYFEAAAVIIVLVLLGQVLELRARSRTGSAIKALLGLAPKTARRLGADGGEAD